MKNTGIAIVSLVGGLIIGSALTMLFAPQSGPELRGHIKDFLDKQKDALEQQKEAFEKELDKARCKCEEK